MSEVLFTITLDTVAETVKFTDNSTDWTDFEGRPDTLTLYMRGENKTTYIVKKVFTAANITSFLATGLTYTYLELFGVNPPTDNFYLVEIIANETLEDQMLSSKVSIGFTYNIASSVYNSTLGVTVPIESLTTSLTLGSMPLILEFLQVLSTIAVYSYDRENKWRKAYNYLNTVVNDLDY